MPVASMPGGFGDILRHKSLLSKPSVADLGALAEAEPNREDLKMWFGANKMVIPVASIAALTLAELVHPFYVFQV